MLRTGLGTRERDIGRGANDSGRAFYSLSVGRPKSKSLRIQTYVYSVLLGKVFLHESQVQVRMVPPFVSGELTDFGVFNVRVDKTGLAT